MNRTAGRLARRSPTHRSARYAAQFIGEAFVTAYNLILAEQGQGRGDRRHDPRGEGDLRRRPRPAARRAELPAAARSTGRTRRVWPKFMNWTSPTRRRGRSGRRRRRRGDSSDGARTGSPNRLRMSEDATTPRHRSTRRSPTHRSPSRSRQRYNAAVRGCSTAASPSIAIAAIVGLVVLVAKPSSGTASSASGWSDWKPSQRHDGEDDDGDRRPRRRASTT